MFLNLTKLSFDNISSVGGNNQKPNTLETIAAPGAALGATALLGKGFGDVAKINNKFTTWHNALNQDRIAIDQLFAGGARQLPPDYAQRFMDTYINGARNITQSKVLGVNAGAILLKNLQLGAVLGRIKEHLGYHIKNRSPIQAIKDIPILTAGIKENLNSGPINHYKLYSDPKTSLNALRKHHIEDAFHNEGPWSTQFLEDVNLPESEGFLKNLLNLYRSKFGQNRYEEIKKKILSNTKSLDGAGTVLKMIGNNRATVLGTSRAYYQTIPAILNKILSKRLPILTGAGALTAASGYHAYNKLKNKQAEDNDLAMDLGTSVGAGLGTGLVGYNVNRGLNPSRNIAVTYGKSTPDFGSWNIGSGHSNPGDALFELLQEAQKEDPELRKFNLSKIIRNKAGIVDPAQLKPNYNIIADTGIGHFGDYWDDSLNTGKRQHPEFFDHSNARPYNSRVGMMTDMFHTSDKTMSGTTLPGLRKGDHAIYYGNSSGPQLSELQARGINTIRANKTFNPLMLNSAVEAARDMTPKEVILDNLLKSRPELTEHIKELHGKKIITISGSGRGDFVGQRAIELSNELEKRGIKNVKILALTAAAGENAELRKALQAIPHVIPIHGKLDNKTFVGLQRIADVHMGSTGTSSLTESMMQSGGRNVVPPTWGQQYGFYENGSLADRWRGWINGEAFIPHTDHWNKGNREFAASMPGGLHLEDDASKIVDFITNDEAVAKAKVEAYIRARIVNEDIDLGRKAVPKAIFDIAKKNITKQRLRGLAGTIAGLGLTGGSIAAWLAHEKAKKNKI
jgi:hypothetical protein